MRTTFEHIPQDVLDSLGEQDYAVCVALCSVLERLSNGRGRYPRAMFSIVCTLADIVIQRAQDDGTGLSAATLLGQQVALIRWASEILPDIESEAQCRFAREAQSAARGETTP